MVIEIKQSLSVVVEGLFTVVILCFCVWLEYWLYRYTPPPKELKLGSVHFIVYKIILF